MVSALGSAATAGGITASTRWPGLQLVAGFGCGNTLDRDLAFRDKPLKAGAADLGKGKRQEAVKPVRGFDGCGESLEGLRRHG